MPGNLRRLIGRTPHREDVSTLARGTGVAFLGGLLASVLGWIGQLLLARLLGPGGFGIYSIGMATVRITSQIGTLGLASATIYFVARYSQDQPTKVPDVLTQSLAASLIAGMLMGSVLFFLAPWIADHFFRRPNLVPVLRVFACTIGFAASFRVARAATTVSYRLNYRVYLDLLTSGVFLLSFVVLYLLGWRLGGATVAFLFSNVIGFAAGAYSLTRLFPDAFSIFSKPSLVLGELLAYSLPAFAASLFSAPMQWMDRILIGYFRRSLDVGLFQAAVQSASLLYATGFAVSAIAGPMIANLYSRGERGRLEDLFRVSTKWMLYSALVAFLVIAFGPGDLLKMLFGSKYQGGSEVFVILSIGALVDAATGTARSMLLLTGHQKALMLISAGVLVLQIGLDVCLIPRYGIAGAAVAEVVAAVALNSSMLIAIKSTLGLSPYDRRYLKGSLAAVITAAGLFFIRPRGVSVLVIRLMLRAVIATAIFAAVLLVVGLDSEDRQVVSSVLEKRLRQ
jgi:O-antigen/teichoic acid export membrane protein